MAVLQIAADQPGAGKTSLAGALLLYSAESGKKAAYYKPFSTSPSEDPDVALVTQSLLGEGHSPQVPPPSPFPPISDAGQSLVNSLAEEIQQTVTRLQDQCDLVLLEGPDLTTPDNQPSPLPLELASLIDSKVLLLCRFSQEFSATQVQQAAESFTDRLAGVLINGVTTYRNGDVKRTAADALGPLDIPFLGTVGEDRGMLAVTVQQIADYLGGQWAQEPENTGACVERFLIGGNIMDLGPTYFGRYANQAVIVRAGRPDIQMASLSAETRCLILTGNDALTEYVTAEALQRGVPLILVDSNTLETAGALGGLFDRTAALSRQRVDRFFQLLRCNLNLDTLLASLC